MQKTTRLTTIEHTLRQGARRLTNSDSPYLDAEILLSKILKTERTYLLSHPEKKINWAQLLIFYWLISKRQHGWPIAYLTKQQEFYGRTFKVNRGVLIPRPETELLVEQTLLTLKNYPCLKTVVEIGVGSGCLICSVALADNSDRKFVGTDLSRLAIKIALDNARYFGLNSRLIFKTGDNLTALYPIIETSNLPLPWLLISNPPYLNNKTYTPALKFEPRLALWGGTDGLDWYRNFFKQLITWPQRLWPKIILWETDSELTDGIIQLNKLLPQPYNWQIIKDLTNHDRIIKLIAT